ncbi:hypothetical protein F300043A5_10000 [Massilimicrobiota timonensis]
MNYQQLDKLFNLYFQLETIICFYGAHPYILESLAFIKIIPVDITKSHHFTFVIDD